MRRYLELDDSTRVTVEDGPRDESVYLAFNSTYTHGSVTLTAEQADHLARALQEVAASVRA